MFTFLLAAVSLPAMADVETGLSAGYGITSASSGGSPEDGLFAGGRVGLAVSNPLQIDLQVSRYSASSGGLATTQIVAGAGARFYLADAELRPFVSGHINHHFEARIEGGGESVALPSSGGLGVQAGVGLQQDISPTLYADARVTFAKQLLGSMTFAHGAVSLGVGLRL